MKKFVIVSLVIACFALGFVISFAINKKSPGRVLKDGVINSLLIMQWSLVVAYMVETYWDDKTIRLQSRIAELEAMHKKLELFGGAIVCSASLSVAEISAAKDEGRMYIDKSGIGYAWIPKDLVLSWAVNDKQN